ncbi:cysteinyl leukotriene receptor 1 isoform X1 [Takifugu flavidus]|nr:cysteinyl leukotriene receptor 1 isoform X1 [Takifugu flavidus]XP_056899731.1 cysteinyl leukotriene receptor 1 isoform X1 [Takifugu flavidus]XP_056899732.1 cysteinyl leukotriene receptor 1 isoform X1 [Takifugu flavidus]XP_056899733.1 cysteinyl leukotriene receptor 1 isoform X1 [Takifugu flavidus]XP_056899734.1 cysteinyl leukotriene receptor 1 isoform X1 [Takifugu flavidus]XP_056899735.1 cysteinyl leukotriene receptor 1 isoform X1 [Takifugu flavidus]TNM99097.1 hypothetical protein fugu_0136
MAHVNATNISQDHATVCPSIDDFRNQVYSTLYSVIIVLGLAGNGLALAALSRPRRQSSSFYIYLVNLAVSDLLCVMMLPLRVVYYVKKGQWDYGDVVCRLTSYSLYVNLYCSIYLMTAMSISRFLAIVFPMKNMQLVKVKCARRVCVCIWLFVCLSTSPFLMNGQHVDSSTNKTKCFEPPQGQGLHKLLVLNYLSLVLGFALPFLVILLCYAAIIWTLLSRKYTVRQQQGIGTKAIRMIVVILLTFFICFMPYHVQRTVHLSFLSRVDTTCAERTTMQKSVVVTLTLAAANSCLDPLLYFFSSKSFHTCSSSTRQSWTDCTKQTT